MNIEQANRIDLSAILKQIGCAAVRQNGMELWYCSPFRKEKTASFHIHVKKNIWYDFGEAKGGDVVTFVCSYLESRNEDHNIIDALRWLKNMHPFTMIDFVSKQTKEDNEPALQLRKVTLLQNPAFIRYLYSRGIPLICGQKYLKEILVYNKKTNQSFSALGLLNENGGYELRNKNFKGSVGQKGITIIRGSTALPNEVHVFEGSMDFFSALVHEKRSRFEGDAIILNSVSCLAQAFPYIENYSYTKINSWLDNDAAGAQAAQRLRDFTGKRFEFKTMNKLYAGYKDVNAWHMAKIGLKPQTLYKAERNI